MNVFNGYISQSGFKALCGKNEKKGEEEATEDDLAKLVENSLQVSSGNGYRFPTNQFGYSLPTTSRFDLNEFEKVLQRYLFLETHCESVEDYTDRIADIDSNDVDLFQAIFFPKSIAPRTPMKSDPVTIMSETSVSAMWFRLTSHYFEWLTGVHEIHLFDDFDKMKLLICNVCKIVCLHVAFCNFHYFSDSDETIFLFGSGFFYDPARCTDPLMGEYCGAMFSQMRRIMPKMRELNITKEEFVLIKLAFFFECNSFYGMSRQGLQLAKSLCTKYRTILAEYVRHQVNIHPNSSELTEEEKNAISMNRVRDLLNFPAYVEVLSEIDNHGLTDMVAINYGGMHGRLQKQIHTESKKIAK